ncbi:PREDICTED: TNF receptor-associated factor 1 [Thamnophis sirtalis]|uniref:TNF receptor-associated factor 1 n=1 Tax=Thamnophis sirtalis TaxID=35019 RepID=A0A6I9YVK0_9SAUR|nr:PREDICTED: TNF receptor-associated factor 1 [Thamnophis sirtalis]
MADLQRSLAQKDAALIRLGQRLHSSEQTSYDGVFLWKITDVHQKCYEAICGKVHSFQSPAFYTSRYGYKLCMRIYLNGEGRGRGTHISLFIVLLKGDYDSLLPWPFTHKVTEAGGWCCHHEGKLYQGRKDSIPFHSPLLYYSVLS